MKGRSLTGSNASAGWVVYSKTLGNTKYLYLNDTDGEATDSGRWNNTTPTASVFSVGDDGVVNTSSSPYIAYCFHSVEGYSKVGSYVGNGNNDGTFIYTGFKPAFFIAKRTDGDDWMMLDNTRSSYNQMIVSLAANDNKVELSSTGKAVDFCSNGIKMRNADNGLNQSTKTFIYIAFAESPFKTSNAR